MKRVLAMTLSLVAVAGLVWAGQDMGGKDQEGPPGPKPTKEHQGLKEMEGTWECVMTSDMLPEDAKGTETVTMVGGFWAVFDVKFPEMMMGQPWHGHGSIGFDPAKKKYVGHFINSMSPLAMTGEGTMDAAGKTMTMIWASHDPSGKPAKMTEVYEKKDKDNATMTMSGPGPDGKEMKHFTITYTRKK